MGLVVILGFRMLWGFRMVFYSCVVGYLGISCGWAVVRIFFSDVS